MNEMQLINAVKATDISAMMELINTGVDVNQQDEHGWTSLNWAAGKGDVEMVKLLVENGADMLKVGRDNRTPYMIALAAARVEVVKYLRDAEMSQYGEMKQKQEKLYCKAYHLRDLRQCPDWKESKINWKERKEDEQTEGEPKGFSDEDVVFIHQDLTVTYSMWHSENVLFNQVTPEWEKFCAEVLKFKVPDDLDEIS
jgi:uncharacterized protein